MIRRVAAVAFASGLAAAAAAQPAAETYRENVNVRVMDIDVVVTDRDGRPVPNLARDDFQIRVDRKPVEIEYFAPVRDGRVAPPDLAELSPDLILQPTEKDRDAAVPRHFLLFIDEASLTPARRKRALDALKDFVRRLGPADEAAIVAERSHPATLVNWTTSREALLAAIDAVSKTSVAGLRRTERERQAMREIEMVGRGAREERARMYEEEVWEETKKTLHDMTDTLALLGDKAGKKVLVVVSEGFELQPGVALLAFAEGRGGGPPSPSFRRDVTPELQAFIDRANALETTIFTVNARGLPGSGTDASNETPLATSSLFARKDSEAGLVEMAEETGGEAIAETNDLDRALGTIYSDASSYYSLGVNLRNVAPAATHKVEVVVSKPGLTVRARRTYTVEDDAQRVEDRVRSTLLTGSAYADLAVSIRTGAAGHDGNLAVLPVDVEVPARDLTFLPDGDHVTARPVYYFVATNDRGDQTPLAHTVQTFTLSPAEARSGRPLVVRINLKLRKGEYALVANVVDPDTGRMGTARTNVKLD